MVKNGHTSKAVADKISKEPLGIAPIRSVGDPSYRWFVDEVKRRLVAQYGEEQVMTGGLTVHTSLDPRRQRAAMKAVRTGLKSSGQTAGVWQAP